MQCGLLQIELHHIDNELNKLHEAVTGGITENVPATAESNGGVIFLAACRFRYANQAQARCVTYRRKWHAEPAHQPHLLSLPSTLWYLLHSLPPVVVSPDQSLVLSLACNSHTAFWTVSTRAASARLSAGAICKRSFLDK